MTDASHSAVVVHPDAGTAETLSEEITALLPDLSVQGVTTDPDAETETALAEADVLVTFELPEGYYDAADPSWVHALTAGVDNYDVARMADDGTILTTASGVAAEPVAEQVVSYMLAFARSLHRALRQQERGEWTWFGGHELAESTVLVVGVGAIGTRVAELSSAFDATVLGVKRTPADAPAVLDEVAGPAALADLLPRADYVVLACPLTAETRGLIDADALDRMDDHAVLVNVARGQVVDEDALVAALEADDIGGAALDVFEEEPLPEDSPLWGCEDAILTPHMAGSTPAYWERSAALFAENYRHFRAGDVDEMRNRRC